MNTIHFPRWLATVGILGGVAIALGVPYIVLAYGADLGSGEVTVQSKGMVALVPASVKQYALEGRGTIYRASVPIEE